MQTNRTSFKSLYGTSGITFQDNTTEEISESDMRQFGEDGADSTMFIVDNAYSMFSATASGMDTYTATLNPAISSYSSDHRYFIKFTNANTGAATLNLNTLGAKPIVKNGSTGLSAGDIAAGQICILAYDGTNLQLIGVAGGSGITNSAATNELMKSDGTNAVASGIFSSVAGNLQLGTGLSGASRVITAAGSVTDVDVQIQAKGTGNAGLLGATSIGATTTQSLISCASIPTVTKLDTGVTNTVIPVLMLSADGSNTPSAGIGASLQFSVDTSNLNPEVGATIEAVTTDVTGGSEDFDLVFKTMAGGATAAEAVRIKSDKSTSFTGPVVFPSYTVAGVPSAASYTGGMIYVTNETGGAVPAFSDGTNWRRVTDRNIIA